MIPNDVKVEIIDGLIAVNIAGQEYATGCLELEMIDHSVQYRAGRSARARNTNPGDVLKDVLRRDKGVGWVGRTLGVERSGPSTCRRIKHDLHIYIAATRRSAGCPWYGCPRSS